MAAAKMEFHGVYTALVTPFTADGASVDYECLKQLVERQINAGVDGLVPVSLYRSVG
jgi:4-hydroxy-tetrahydrodipicolinate synthase